MKVRKRPIEVEAWQWNGLTQVDANAFCDFYNLPKFEIRHTLSSSQSAPISALAIPTLEGTMFANTGDWIIRGVKGEFYPCKPDIFEKTYEIIPETQTANGT